MNLPLDVLVPTSLGEIFQPALVAWLGGFAIVWAIAASRDAMGTSTAYHAFRAALWSISRFCHRIEVRGRMKVPEKGGFLVVANHTCGLTPVKVSFIVAREVYELAWLRPICKWLDCIPVSRSGNDTAAIRQAQRLLSEHRAIAIFPEGGIVMGGLGKGKPGAALLALKANVPIIPIFFHGTPESWKLWQPPFMKAKVTAFIGEPFQLDLDEPAAEAPNGGADTASPVSDRRAQRSRLERATDQIMQRIATLRDAAFAELGEPEWTRIRRDEIARGMWKTEGGSH
jgi:1-acyl-sn-glycerol-3-phosphate acyltransferase